MAVNITSQFYADSEWKSISKIVFTSPNMDTPSVAGTRSHILPGEGNLGLWYEDTTNMYRINDSQTSRTTDFYNIKCDVLSDTNLDPVPDYIDVHNVSHNDIDTTIRRRSGASTPVGYSDISGDVYDTAVRLEYISDTSNLDELFLQSSKSGSSAYTSTGKYNEETSTFFYNDYSGTCVTSHDWANYGWVVDVIDTIENCYITIEFSNPVCINKFYLNSLNLKEFQYNLASNSSEDYNNWVSTNGFGLLKDGYPIDTYCFIGNFTLEGSNDESEWTTLHTGQITDNYSFTGYLTDNSDFYTYYRINIQDNSSLDSGVFDVTKYGINGLTFYTKDYSTEGSSDYTHLYDFNDFGNVKIIRINNATSMSDGSPTISGTESTDASSGTIKVTTVSGSPDYSVYSISLDKISDSDDYVVNATAEASTVSGVGTGSDGTIYSKSDNIYVTINSTVEFIDNTIFCTISGSENDFEIDNYRYTGTGDLSFYSTVSGTSTDDVTYNVSGNTTREYDYELYEKRSYYRFYTDSVVMGSGILNQSDSVCLFNGSDFGETTLLGTDNSIVFEVTNGEAYDCRLTAWDDETHSTTSNEVIRTDRARVDALAYCSGGTSKLDVSYIDDPVCNYVFPPAHNKILKGNTTLGDYKYYYGDFNMVYRYQTGVYGDYLIFRPFLYNIDDTISYGVHDFVTTLHYSYT